MNPADWIGNTRQYLDGVSAEWKKITWPPQNETIAGTMGVFVVVTIITVVLAVVDFGLSQLMGMVIQ